MDRKAETESAKALWPRLLCGALGLALVLALTRYWALFDVGLPRPYDEKRLLEFAFLALVVLSLVFSPAARWAMARVVAGLPAFDRRLLFGLLVVGAVSALGAPLPGHAVSQLSLYGLLAIASLGLAAAFRGEPKEARFIILFALVLISFHYSLIYLTPWLHPGNEALTATQGQALHSLKLFPNFSNRRFLNQFQSWTMALAILPAMLLPARYRLARWALLLGAALWWMLVFTTDSRGSALAVGAGLVAALALYRRRALGWLGWQGAAALGGLALYLVIFVLGRPEAGTDIGRLAPSGRLDLARAALDLWRSHPLFGIGPEHFAATANPIASHPHDFPLQWLAEWGSLWTAGALLLIGRGIRGWMRATASPHASGLAAPPAIAASLTASLTGGLVHGLFSGIAVMPLSQLMAALTVGWMLALARCAGNLPPPAPDSPGKMRGALLAGLALVFATSLVWRTVVDLPRITAAPPDFRDPGFFFKPRLWSDGRLGRRDVPANRQKPR